MLILSSMRNQVVLIALLFASSITYAAQTNPVVDLKTNLGLIKVELNSDKAPITVKNFLNYVQSGHYNGTVFHRVIDGFMIQGGGFNAQLQQKPTQAPINNEANNGLKNHIGTIAMARTADPNSATAQFFINVANNDFLDQRPGNPGYAVFGKVTAGMDIVNRIAKTKTGLRNGMQDVPLTSIVIESASIEKSKQK